MNVKKQDIAELASGAERLDLAKNNGLAEQMSAQSEVLASLARVQAQKAQHGISITREGIRANGMMGAAVVAIIVFSLCWVLVKVGPALVAAWKSDGTASQPAAEQPQE